MAEDAQTLKLLSVDPLPTSSSTASSSSLSASSAFSNATSLLGLAATTYSKFGHLGSKIKPPDLNATEDYNNNSIDNSCGSGLSKAYSNNNNDPNCDNYHHHFISVDNHCLSDKWNSLRSESPFLASNMISPPPCSSSVAGVVQASNNNNNKSMCTSGMSISGQQHLPGGLTASHQSMLANQLLNSSMAAAAATNNSSSSSSSAASNGSIPHKCMSNGNGNHNLQPVKKGENCMTHAMPNTLWCLKCHTLICRACAGSDEHRNHTVKTQAKEAIRTEIATELGTMQKSLIEVQHLVLKQRDFLLKILESCSSLKSQVENELINHAPTMEVAELRDSFCRAKLCLNVLDQSAAANQNGDNNNIVNGGQGSGSNATSPTSPTSPTPIELYKLYTNLTTEKQRLHQKYQDLYLQCKFDDLLRSAGHVIDYETISRAMQTLHIDSSNNASLNSGPLLLMANYCLTQIYTRQNSTSKQTPPQMTLNSLAGGGGINGSHAFGGGSQSELFPFASNGTSTSNAITASQSPGNINISQFGAGTKSPFLDLAVGSPASSNSGMPGSLSHLHHQHSLHFGQSQQNAQSTATASQILGGNHSSSSSFGHSSMFGDNLLLSNAFQQQQQQVATTNHHHHGLTSSLNALRHHSGIGNGSSGAGGISFEMNGVSVPITMISSQKFPTGLQTGGSHHPLHNHHNHHLLHSTNLSSSSSNSSGSNSIICNPTVHIYPIYYFSIEINGQPCGRILIEVRNDVAPRMAKNFGALASGELGFGYKGCQIFQCWENESIITGDFELNNGRGGRSVFEDGFFMPDDTKILAIRGSVGMRRSQKRHDNMGLVGSQFRIILREMRGFTGIFAFVIEGLELVEKISQTGDSAGKPQSSVLIVSCGKLQ